eukprot:GHVT01004240.1.p1 GENE.GHVT01004240.1~~GHVT01004240.1.p1  ORF type:complete len:132 (-),score=28.67 GHVT01004240.1:760-1155(-)
MHQQEGEQHPREEGEEEEEAEGGKEEGGEGIEEEGEGIEEEGEGIEEEGEGIEEEGEGGKRSPWPRPIFAASLSKLSFKTFFALFQRASRFTACFFLFLLVPRPSLAPASSCVFAGLDRNGYQRTSFREVP